MALLRFTITFININIFSWITAKHALYDIHQNVYIDKNKWSLKNRLRMRIVSQCIYVWNINYRREINATCLKLCTFYMWIVICHMWYVYLYVNYISYILYIVREINIKNLCRCMATSCFIKENCFSKIVLYRLRIGIVIFYMINVKL